MELDTDVSTGDAMALGGAVLVGVGAFLPWVTRTVEAGAVDVSATTAGIEGLGVLTLALAVVATAVVLVDEIDGKQSIVTGLLGLIVFLVSGWKLLDVPDPASPGVGLYMTLLGAIMTIGSAVLTHQSTTNEQRERLDAT